MMERVTAAPALRPPDDATGPRRPLRVQFFVSFVHPQGTYFRFHNLSVGLIRLGHRVTVFAADHDYRTKPRREDRDGVWYHILPETLLNRVFGPCCEPVTVVQRWVRRYPRVDVAHLFQPFPSAWAAWARADCRARFYDWDDLWTGGVIPARPRLGRGAWSAWATRHLESRLPARADHVTAISRSLADRARALGAKGVTLLNSGSWPLPPLDRPTARARLGLRPDALYVGFMGRTAAELPWCFDALAEAAPHHPRLRLAVCGAPASYLQGLPPSVRGRVDYLGQLTPEDARTFAGCLDLGLIPLGANEFNLNRLPQKFGDHLGTGVPVLCSDVGECGRLAARFRGAVLAGHTRDDWVRAFAATVGRIAEGRVEPPDRAQFDRELSWLGLSQTLAGAYRSVLGAALAPRPVPDRRPSDSSRCDAPATSRGDLDVVPA